MRLEIVRSFVLGHRQKAFVHAVMEGMTARTLRGRGPAECGVAIVFLIIVTP